MVEKYTMSLVPRNEINCFTVVITADYNDGDYLTTTSTFSEREFDETYADQVIKLIKEFGAHYKLSTLNYGDGIELDIPHDTVSGERCHTLTSVKVTYVDSYGHLYNVDMMEG